MEGELLCNPTSDSLIIPDKMQQEQHPEKVDGNVAQKIQADCDKKFNDSHVSNGHAEVEDALSNGNADAGDDVKANGIELKHNGDRTNEEAEKHEAEQFGNKEKPDFVEEQHVDQKVQDIPEQEEGTDQVSEKIPEVEEDINMDSLNIAQDSIATFQPPEEIPKVEIVETIEKVEKIEETKPETPEPVEEPKQVPKIIESPAKETVEEMLENGHTDQNVEEKVETVEEVTTPDESKPVSTPEEEKMECPATGDMKTESPVPEQEAPIKGHYQPEQIENFGISVRDMVNDMPRIIEDDMKAPKESMPNAPRKGAIATSMDTESVRDAYNDIRADNSETMWAVFKYEASRIVCAAKGVAFDEFKKLFDDDERAYGYIRLQTGDEMSKRYKFLFVTWIGPGVSVLKRAKMSIDKAIIKNVVSNFAVELQLETQAEFDLPFFIESLNKASGANYGTGVRDI